MSIYLIAAIFLIASWVIAIFNAWTAGSRPSPTECALWAIAVIVVFSKGNPLG